jgi:hypothetical protein
MRENLTSHAVFRDLLIIVFFFHVFIRCLLLITEQRRGRSSSEIASHTGGGGWHGRTRRDEWNGMVRVQDGALRSPSSTCCVCFWLLQVDLSTAACELLLLSLPVHLTGQGGIFELGRSG